MVVARVAADADRETLLESLRAVADNRAMYGVSGIARLLSGEALLLAGWFLLRTWIIRERRATPLVPYLFVLSGIFTALSGACAVLIAVHPAPEATYLYATPTAEIAPVVEWASGIRWISGKIGFAIAGAALLIAAKYQWQVGGALRKMAPLSAVIGAVMQFIWIDSATVMHQIIGPAFFLWLLAIGTMLAAGRVERLFLRAYGDRRG